MAKILIEITDELKKKLKVRCAKLGKFQKDVITDLIKEWLKK